MTDKQDAVSGGFPLPGWQVVEATGADAAAFLQAQTMNDVRALEPGRWQWNGWLNPKGRLIALFALALLDAQRYWLVVPDFPAAELAARLRRFVFRSKVKLEVREDCGASGRFEAPERAQGAAFDHRLATDAQHMEFDLGAEGGSRTLRIWARNDAPSPFEPAPTHPGAVRWAAFDLAHGLPRLPAGQAEAWTPQMLSLERLHAFSLRKGCYPGQEIVARTHYLGQAKRALARIVGGAPAAGSQVLVGEQAVGTVVCDAGGESLAVVSIEKIQDAPPIDGHPGRWDRLLEGLARPATASSS